ncbi:MAG: hypothetical protein KUG73_00450 [Pseudomonadales bacterium]|nr:hypothetical protein [Pseudomonadales bacterium]
MSARLWIIVVAVVFTVISGRLHAADTSIVLVVNDSVEIEQISIDSLRAIYSLRQLSWSDGVEITTFVLDIDGDAHRQFCRDLLKVYPHQLKKGWDRMEYTGRARVPKVVQSEQMLLDLVKQIPGAIGYVQRDVEALNVHMVSVLEE